MLSNRSIRRCTVIPELAYPDVTKAAEWLCDVFGFTLRLAIGDHRAQLNVGDGAVVVTERLKDAGSSDKTHSVLVRIEDVDRHHQHVLQRGVQILRQPADHPYGRTSVHGAGFRRSRSGHSPNPLRMLILRIGAAHREKSTPPPASIP